MNPQKLARRVAADLRERSMTQPGAAGTDSRKPLTTVFDFQGSTVSSAGYIALPTYRPIPGVRLHTSPSGLLTQPATIFSATSATVCGLEVRHLKAILSF